MACPRDRAKEDVAMAQPQVLLFNLTGEKRRRIRFLLIKLGLGCVEVPAKDFGCTGCAAMWH